jgi:hypothetical protein
MIFKNTVKSNIHLAIVEGCNGFSLIGWEIV